MAVPLKANAGHPMVLWMGVKGRCPEGTHFCLGFDGIRSEWIKVTPSTDLLLIS